MEDKKQDLKIQELQSNQEFMSKEFSDLKKEMNKGFNRIEKQLNNQQKEAEKKYAPRVEFRIVKGIVFGMVALIVLSFLGALVDNTISETANSHGQEVRQNK